MTNLETMKLKVTLLENYESNEGLSAFSAKLKRLGKDADMTALESEYQALLLPFAEPGDGNRTLLMRAAAHANSSGYIELMEDLLAIPAIEIDEETDGVSGDAGVTALLLAVKSRNVKAVLLLVNAGAKVDMTPATNVFGILFNETPLSIAIKNNDTTIVDILRNAGVKEEAFKTAQMGAQQTLLRFTNLINYGPQNVVHPESNKIYIHDSINPNSKLF